MAVNKRLTSVSYKYGWIIDTGFDMMQTSLRSRVEFQFHNSSSRRWWAAPINLSFHQLKKPLFSTSAIFKICRVKTLVVPPKADKELKLRLCVLNNFWCVFIHKKILVLWVSSAALTNYDCPKLFFPCTKNIEFEMTALSHGWALWPKKTRLWKLEQNFLITKG